MKRYQNKIKKEHAVENVKSSFFKSMLENG